MLARVVKILLDTASILHYTFGANSALTVMTPQRAIRCTGLSRPFSFCANAVLKVYDFLLYFSLNGDDAMPVSDYYRPTE